MAKSEDAIRFRAKRMPWKVGSRAGAAVLLPAGASRALGRRGPAPVRATVNGYGFEASAHPTGDGRHTVWVNRKAREAASVEVEDRVEVVLEVRSAPPRVAIPADLRSALSRSPEAKGLFERLPPSHQRAYLEFVQEAKRPETRLKRIAQTIERLEGLRKAPRGDR